jgi:cytoskeletal protein RodZ
MSLINDALKRAKEADSQRPVDPPITVGLRPVDEPGRKGGVFGSIFVLVVALGILTGAIWFIWQAFNPAPPPPLAVAPAKPAIQPAANPAAASPAPVASASLPSASQPSAKAAAAATAQPGSNAAPVAPPAAPLEPAALATLPAPASPTNPVTAAVAAAPVPPTRWPELRVQAVFYRLNNPSVRINGRTLFVNQEIEGVRVAAIQRDGAELVFHGENKTVKVGQSP